MENTKFISREMLNRDVASGYGRRWFYMAKKLLFRNALRAFAKHLPKYPEYRITDPNGHQLVEIKNLVLEHYILEENRQLLEDLFDIFIAECDHDPEKRHILGFVIEEVIERVLDGRWKPRPTHTPGGKFWKEDRTWEGDYGMFRGRSFAQYIKKREVE